MSSVVVVAGGGGRVEGAVAAEEGGVRDGATPPPAHGRGADEGDMRVHPLENEAQGVVVHVHGGARETKT